MLLRKANVVDGALALLDDTGLDDLTMRRLGDALGVRASALYRHFPGKQALLDAMAERILESIDLTLEPGPWDERGLILAGRLRHALLRHRDGARVVAGSYTAGTHTVLFGNTSAALLLEAGLPPQQAAWAVTAVSHYVIGHTIEEQSRADLVDEGSWPQKMDALAGLADGVALAAFDADPQERFLYGLRLLLNGIRQELATAG